MKLNTNIKKLLKFLYKNKAEKSLVALYNIGF